MSTPVWMKDATDEHASIEVALTVYSLEVLLRVCYLYTESCYMFLEPQKGTDGVIQVYFTRKSARDDVRGLVGNFANDLIDQQVRAEVAAETRVIRELIVAQAFTEADLLEGAQDADFRNDPKGITQ